MSDRDDLEGDEPKFDEPVVKHRLLKMIGTLAMLVFVWGLGKWLKL